MYCRLSCKKETTEFLEKKVGKILHDLVFGGFLNAPVGLSMTEKNKLDLIKIENICVISHSESKKKKRPWLWDNMSHKEILPKIYKES